jgi:hypothetical protein
MASRVISDEKIGLFGGLGEASTFLSTGSPQNLPFLQIPSSLPLK